MNRLNLTGEQIKRPALSALFVLGLLFFLLSAVFAAEKAGPVTPYGDFCKRCGNYGTCRNAMNSKDAEKALLEYYSEKDYTIDIEKAHGRFIRARVLDKGAVVDVILIDRRTGRIRSVQ